MLKICAKCSHANPDATGAETDACPACGAIYAKVQAAVSRAAPSTAAPRPVAPRRSTRGDGPFIDRLRAQSQYPTFRQVVGLFTGIGYVLAALVGVGSVMVAFRGGAAPAVGGIVFACLIVIFSRFAKEASLMLADLSDAMVRMAERQETPDA